MGLFVYLSQENPCQHPIIILRDASYTDVEGLVRYIYRGEVDVQPQQLQSFLKTADTLKIKGLADQCLDKEAFDENGEQLSENKFNSYIKGAFSGHNWEADEDEDGDGIDDVDDEDLDELEEEAEEAEEKGGGQMQKPQVMEPLKVPSLPFSCKTPAASTASALPIMPTGLLPLSSEAATMDPPPNKRMKSDSTPWTTTAAASAMTNCNSGSSPGISSTLTLTSTSSGLVTNNASIKSSPLAQARPLATGGVGGRSGRDSACEGNLVIAAPGPDGPLKMEDVPLSSMISAKNQAFNISNLATSSTTTSTQSKLLASP